MLNRAGYGIAAAAALAFAPDCRARTGLWRDRTWRRGVGDRHLRRQRQEHQERLRVRGQEDQRRRRREDRRQVLSLQGQILRRRIDPGARGAVGRTPDRSGQDPVRARPLRLAADQGDPAGHRKIQDAAGAGRGGLALAVHARVQISFRHRRDLREIYDAGRRHGGAARQEGGQGPVQGQDRDDLSGRCLLARRAPGRRRRHEEIQDDRDQSTTACRRT